MTNLLIIHLGLAPCVIETIRFYNTLQNNGELNVRSLHAEHISCQDILWCDLAVFVRSSSTIELHLMKLLQKHGKFIILVLDDDLLSLDDSYGKDGEGVWKPRQKVLLNTLYHVDCLIAVNEKLAEKYSKLGNISRCVLMNTMVENDEFFPDRQLGENRETVKMVIYVNDGTTGMFDLLIKPVLPKLTNRYPKQLELYLMALCPNLDAISDDIKIIYVPHLPYREFKKYMGTEYFDIGLAPLLDTGFSIYKYFNKYIEYTLAGIPAIYSDCTLYRKVIKDGENGLLCQNTVDGWYDAICKMIESPSLRKQLIINAQNHLFINFGCESNIEHLKKELPQICNYKAPKVEIKWLLIKLLYFKWYYRAFRLAGWCYMFKTYIKKRKFYALYKRFKSHFLNK